MIEGDSIPQRIPVEAVDINSQHPFSYPGNLVNANGAVKGLTAYPTANIPDGI